MTSNNIKLQSLHAMTELSQDDLDILLGDESFTSSKFTDSFVPKVYTLTTSAAGEATTEDDIDDDDTSEDISHLVNVRESHSKVTAKRGPSIQQLSRQQEYLHRIEALENRLATATNEKRLMEQKISVLSNATPMPRQAIVNNDRRQLDEIRNNIAQIVPTELEYIQMQGVSDLNKTVLDLVRTKVFEQVYAIKAEVNSLRRDRLADSCKAQDMTTLQKQKNLLEEAFHDKETALAHMAARISGLEADLSLELDRIKEKLACAANKLGKSDNDNALLRGELEQLKESKRILLVQKEESMRTIDILKVDKAYLEKEVASSSCRISLLEEKLAKRSSELEDLKESQLNKYQSVLSTNEQHRVDYEKRLQEELASIRRRTGEDLDDIRRNTRDMHEREIKTLREQVSVGQEELRRMGFENDHLKSSINTLTHEYHADKSKLESDKSSLTQQCKVKAFEYDRIKLVYEDTVHQIQRVQLDNEKYSQKLDILTKEYQQLQIDTTKRILENSSRDGKENLSNVNTEAPRRSEDMARISRLNEQVEFLDKLLSSVKQPHHSLIMLLRNKEEQLVDLRMHHQKDQEILNALQKERDSLMKERLVLLTDIKTLVGNRQQMSQIKKLLSETVRNTQSKSTACKTELPKPFVVRAK